MALAATYVCVCDDSVIGLPSARFVPVGGGPSSAAPQTSNSESWPAGQLVLAVIWRRTYRVVVAAKVTVAAGLKVWVAEAAIVVNVEPFALPWTVSVCVRLGQPAGSLSTSRLTLALVPRSTWIHCGKALFADSQ
ncbi:hypothetical protein Nocox_07535 [Nonomuraea coxensis DSM 45129]|uniref:Secreted protein n=1 Tax=Nonomuraea coxensis DSM 45129 TaxID=1122611 RepID=A0ABX8TXE1_9ACTN|nr:hypothetical protein Nocox_07535 [Nonomuraea coxensis DSM 45129]